MPHRARPKSSTKPGGGGGGRGGANRASRAGAIRSCVAPRYCHLSATHRRQCSCRLRSGSPVTAVGAQDHTTPRLLHTLPAIGMTFPARAARFSAFWLQVCLVVTLPSAGTSTQVSLFCQFVFFLTLCDCLVNVCVCVCVCVSVCVCGFFSVIFITDLGLFFKASVLLV